MTPPRACAAPAALCAGLGTLWWEYLSFYDGGKAAMGRRMGSDAALWARRPLSAGMLHYAAQACSPAPAPRR